MNLGTKVKIKLWRSSVILLLVLVILSSFASHTYAIINAPLRVRFTGTLFPIEERGSTGTYATLGLIIRKESYSFQLDKVEILARTGLARSVLERIFPPNLRLTGPNELIHGLENPEVVGQLITIEGLLYTGSGILLVMAVDRPNEGFTNRRSSVGIHTPALGYLGSLMYGRVALNPGQNLP